MPEPLLTLKEAADYLRLTPSALYTQRHRGEKPGALGIRVGKKILYRPSDIERFLHERLAGHAAVAQSSEHTERTYNQEAIRRA